MRGLRLARPLFCALVFAGILPAQTPAKVDFGKDVLPILRQNCVGCHGPSHQQRNGLTEKRRISAARSPGQQ